jgi:hypothetical protein
VEEQAVGKETVDEFDGKFSLLNIIIDYVLKILLLN